MLSAMTTLVSQLRIRINDSVQSRVEQLAAEAKRQSVAGDASGALDSYRQAADLMLGAPWLQLRTAELARKLQQLEVAVLHYRRAAAAFVAAGFPKRALAPLRNAWQSSMAALPAEANAFVTLTLELAQVQRDLGFGSDGIVSIANANQALVSCGCADRVPLNGEQEAPESRVIDVTPRSLSELGVRSRTALGS